MNLFKKVEDVKNDFTTFPRSFENYRWYKPILVAVLSIILFFVLSMIMFFIFGLIYPGMLFNVFDPSNIMSNAGFNTPLGVLLSLCVVLLIPSVFIANRIIKDRPFSSLLSSVGGWNWSIFAKSALVFIIIYAIMFLIEVLIKGVKWEFKLTILSFLVLVVITPFQCFAEELIYRGFLMQTFGSWFRIPVIAIILQAIIFMFSHGYNSLGSIGVLFTGLCFGVLAYYSKGLEVTSAMHSVNNIISFLIAGITAQALTDNVTLWSCFEGIAVTLVCVVAIFLIDKKTNWIGLKKE